MANRTRAITTGGWPGGWNWADDEPLIAEGELAEVQNLSINPLGALVARHRWTDTGVNLAPSYATDKGANYWTTGAGVFARANSQDWAWFGVRSHTAAGQFWYWRNNTTKGKIQHLFNSAPTDTPAPLDAAQYGNKYYFVFYTDLVGGGPPDEARSARWDDVSTITNLQLLTDPANPSAPGTSWNANYGTPLGFNLPLAQTICEHRGYLFIGYTSENGSAKPNRLRFSHPGQPEDWALNDFFDIMEGGENIVAIRSFEDHLVIFKDRSIWALYGYDSDTWQVTNLTSEFGTVSPSSVVEGANALWFANDRGVFRYDGRKFEDVSRKISRYFEGGNYVNVSMNWNAGASEWQPTTVNTPWKGLDFGLLKRELMVSWVNGRLWVSCPHPLTSRKPAGHPDNANGASVQGAGWVLVYDPHLDAWTTFRGRDHCGVYRVVYVRQTQWVNDGGHSAGGNTGDRYMAMNGAWPKLMIVEDPDWERWEHYYGTGSGSGIGPKFWFRTPWMTGGIPTLKKRWRRADIICAGRAPNIDWASMTDFETWNHRYGAFSSPLIAQGAVSGAADYGIARTSAFGNARSVSLLIHSQDPAFASPVANHINIGEEFRVSGLVFKIIPRRLR